MKGGQPKTIYLKDYQEPTFWIDEVELEFELDPEKTRVTSLLRLRQNPNQSSRDLELHGQDMTLVAISLDGKELSASDYDLGDDSLVLLDLPGQCELQIITEIAPAKNTALEGLYQSSGNYCTQCEAEGFRKITYYLDRPDVMARFTTKIIAPKQDCKAMLSNGNLVDSGELEDGRHWVQWEDPYKKPSYLFALVAGNLEYVEDKYTTGSGREVTLQIYVEPENLGKCDHAMRSLIKSMQWDEQVFGLEYDLDIYMIVAVSDFNMGAMENKGLNVFNTRYVLADQASATDADFFNIESVIAHEYFHNWTGNRVTCRDWFQLSLKEGLTVFRDQEFSADMNSRATVRIGDVSALRSFQFLEDASPMAHPVRPDSYVEINNFYTATVYNKGAEVVRMYHTILGVDGFRKGMDLYFQRHDGQAVTTDDFFQAMVDANKRPLAGFKNWYKQAGTPVLKIETHYDAAKNKYFINASQSCPATPGQEHKDPFLIPIRLGLLDKQGRDMPVIGDDVITPEGTNDAILLLKSNSAEFELTDVSEEPVLSVLRGFSAPVKLDYDRPDAELCFLLAHDSDAFNRWEAGQSLVMDLLKQMIAAYPQQSVTSRMENYVSSIGRVLDDYAQDPELTAEILQLPLENYLAEQIDPINVEAVHHSRRYLQRVMGEQLGEKFRAIYDEYNVEEEYSIDAYSMGKRGLKNTCLRYLMETQQTDSIELAYQQFKSASNMTESIEALGLLVRHSTDYAEEVLETFYQRWQHDALVLDKWFSVQAVRYAEDVLDRVVELTQHSAFSLKNPNRARSLLSTFFSFNPVNFHRADGKGYELLYKYVKELDPLNPQVAASWLKQLSRWRQYEEPRRTKMQEILEEIVRIDGLSPDCYEIAVKSLS